MSEIHPIRISHLAVLFLILSGAIFVRWYKIDSASLAGDEFLSLEVSAGHGYEHLDLEPDVILKSPEKFVEMNSTGTWPDLFLSLRRTNHPPLYFCILRIWRTIFNSDSDAAARSLSAILSIVAILLAFDAVRTSSGNSAALWAAALLAVATPQIEFAQEARGYTLLIALMIGACAAILRIERYGFSRRRFAALIFCAACMMLTHYLGLALFAAMIIYTAIRFRGEIRRNTLLALSAAFLCVVVLWGPLMFQQWHGFFTNLQWFKAPPQERTSWVIERFLSLPLRFFASPNMQPGIVSYLSVILFFLPLLLLRKHPQMLLWCLIIWIDVFVITAGDVGRGTRGLLLRRYTLPAATAANILAAMIFTDSGKWLRHLAPAALVLASIMTLPLSYAREKPDWRKMAEYVDRNCRTDSLFVFYPNGMFDVGLSHYSESWGKPIVMLDHPADQLLLHQLQSKGVIDVVSGSVDPQEILPGCVVLASSYFPDLGIVARVKLPRSPELTSVNRS